MIRYLMSGFVACSLLFPSIAFANFKVAEFTFLPSKSKKVFEVKTTVRDSLKEDRSQKKLDDDFKLSDEQLENLLGKIVLTK